MRVGLPIARSADPGLIGRDDESARTVALVRKYAADGGGLLVLGEAGVGKSALLDLAATVATASGTRVLRSAGAEFETDVSFATLNQLLGPLQDRFAELSDLHRRALSVALGLGEGPAPDRLVVANAALALLRRTADVQPVLVIVDDLPWVDPASGLVLAFVSRRLTGTRVGLIAAQRLTADPFLAVAAMTTLTLSPLTKPDARRLLLSRFPRLASAVQARVVSESAGNPLALLELPRELSEPQQSAAQQLPAQLPLSRRLRELFAARVRGVPSSTREMLLRAALDGSGDTKVARSVEGTDVDDLAAAEEARLLAVDPHTRRLAFSHPLVRSAIVEVATDAQKRAAHLALAALFADAPDVSVRHEAEAAVGPSEPVAGRLEEVAYRVLARGDPRAAVVMLLRAADLSPTGPGQARRLSEAAYVGADATGAMDDVAGLLARARAADPGHGVPLSSAVAASYVLLSDGDLDTAYRLLVAALGSRADLRHDGHAADDALGTLLLMCFFANRRHLWAPFVVALSRRGEASAAVLAVSAQTLADPARSTGATLARLDAALAVLDEDSDPGLISQWATAAIFVDRLDQCRPALLRVARSGTDIPAIRALLIVAVGEFMSGRWPEATTLADRALVQLDAQPFPMLLWTGWHAQALVAAGRGEDDRCAELCTRMQQWSAPRGLHVVERYVAHVAALAAIGRGRYQEAFDRLRTISTPGTFAAYEPFALWVVLDLVEAAERSGHHDAACAHVETARAGGIALISSRTALLCAGAEAMVAEPSRAADLYERALTLPGTHRWPLDHARVRLAYGEWLRRFGSTTDARTHLSAALAAFEEIGAAAWAERARTELRASGATRQSARAAGTADLTPQEHHIAMLAATGLSNRQIAATLFLSPRTVGAHLYRIFPKLGIQARAGLRDALSAIEDQPGHDHHPKAG